MNTVRDPKSKFPHWQNKGSGKSVHTFALGDIANSGIGTDRGIRGSAGLFARLAKVL